MFNEGVVSTFQFDGERAHTDDHPPVLLHLALSTGAAGATGASATLKPGQLMKFVTAENAYAPLASNDSDAPCAVVDTPCNAATETSALCLVHGFCKHRLLTTSDGKAPSAAQVAGLARHTVYCL